MPKLALASLVTRRIRTTTTVSKQPQPSQNSQPWYPAAAIKHPPFPSPPGPNRATVLGVIRRQFSAIVPKKPPIRTFNVAPPPLSFNNPTMRLLTPYRVLIHRRRLPLLAAPPLQCPSQHHPHNTLYLRRQRRWPIHNNNSLYKRKHPRLHHDNESTVVTMCQDSASTVMIQCVCRPRRESSF